MHQGLDMQLLRAAGTIGMIITDKKLEKSTFGEGNKCSGTGSSSSNTKEAARCASAIRGKAAARRKCVPLIMKQLQFHLCPIKNIFIFYNAGRMQMPAEIIQKESPGLQVSINPG